VAEGYAKHQYTADRGVRCGALQLQALEVRVEAHQADLPFAAQGPEESQDDHGGDAIAEPGVGGIDLAGQVGGDCDDGEQRVVEAHAVHDVEH
jgi:hypothetical protein